MCEIIVWIEFAVEINRLKSFFYRKVFLNYFIALVPFHSTDFSGRIIENNKVVKQTAVGLGFLFPGGVRKFPIKTGLCGFAFWVLSHSRGASCHLPEIKKSEEREKLFLNTRCTSICVMSSSFVKRKFRVNIFDSTSFITLCGIF